MPCQEGLPGHEQGGVIFPCAVGIPAWRSLPSVWLLLRVLPVAETEAQEKLGRTSLG